MAKKRAQAAVNNASAIFFRTLIACTLAFALLTSVNINAKAQTTQDEDMQRRLRLIDDEIKLLRNRISSLQSREQTTSRTLEELKTKYRLHLREVERLGLEITALEKRAAELNSQTAELSESLRERQGMLGKILRRMYISGRYGTLQTILSVSETRDLGLAQSYFSLLGRREADFITSYKTDISTLHEQRIELRSTRTELLELQRDEQSHAEEALSAQNEQKRILGEIRSKRGIYNKALEEKLTARRELQELIARVTAGETAAAATAFNTMRGRLPWPCRGEVITNFGRVRDPNYDVVLENDGIDIQAPLGSPIYAIFDGTVVFRDWIKERGNMVVLDHGNGYYTLYAHLDRFSVEKGSRVSTGQRIGVVGETGSLKGPVLHFEIRQRAEPLNPVNWLRKLQE